MSNNRSKLSPLALFLLVLSLALNLHGLSSDSFWGDEIFTASFANQSPGEVITWTASDIHPPLYYLVAGTFARLIIPLGTTELPTATSDWLWRFPSVLAAVLAVAVTYNLACRILYFIPHPSLIRYHKRPIAQFAAFLLTLTPIAIKYGQEARMHALFMLLSALSTWLFFRAMYRPTQWSRWLVFALVSAANIYTMYFGFLILASQASFLFCFIIDNRLANNQTHIKQDNNIEQNKLPIANPQLPIPNYQSHIIGFTLAIAITFLLYIPWWPVLFEILRKRMAVGAIEGGVGAPLDFSIGVVKALGPTPSLAAWGFLLIFLTGLLFLARHYWPLAIFSGLWLGLPVALPVVLGDPRALQFRYAFVLPVYLIVIAYAIINIVSVTRLNISENQRAKANTYLIWVLATVSFIATLDFYNQTKPNWREAARYLEAHAAPADIILIGPLWDEGRFISYYYRGKAQLLTPAAMVTNIERRAEGLRSGGGQVWAVNRFAPAESPAFRNIAYSGVVISEPQIAVYEPELLTEAVIDLAAQAVDAAYPWAAEAEAQGVLNPDPRTAQAAALHAWGDALMAAGHPEEALQPYQKAVDIFPGWVSGFIALAEAQEAVGNLPDAAEAYRQAVAFNLKWQGTQADEALSLSEAGNWSAALDKYHDITGN